MSRYVVLTSTIKDKRYYYRELYCHSCNISFSPVHAVTADDWKNNKRRIYHKMILSILAFSIWSNSPASEKTRIPFVGRLIISYTKNDNYNSDDDYDSDHNIDFLVAVDTLKIDDHSRLTVM